MSPPCNVNSMDTALAAARRAILAIRCGRCTPHSVVQFIRTQETLPRVLASALQVREADVAQKRPGEQEAPMPWDAAQEDVLTSGLGKRQGKREGKEEGGGGGGGGPKPPHKKKK